MTTSRGIAGWTWEIRRRPRPLGVLLSGADFETAFVAKLLAGEKALAELRRQLAEEANVA